MDEILRPRLEFVTVMNAAVNVQATTILPAYDNGVTFIGLLRNVQRVMGTITIGLTTSTGIGSTTSACVDRDGPDNLPSIFENLTITRSLTIGARICTDAGPTIKQLDVYWKDFDALERIEGTLTLHATSTTSANLFRIPPSNFLPKLVCVNSVSPGPSTTTYYTGVQTLLNRVWALPTCT